MPGGCAATVLHVPREEVSPILLAMPAPRGRAGLSRDERGSEQLCGHEGSALWQGDKTHQAAVQKQSLLSSKLGRSRSSNFTFTSKGTLAELMAYQIICGQDKAT